MKPALRVPAGRRDALLAALAAAPIFLAACAIPDGGLFRAARFRDLHIYQGYAERFLHGALPYRDVFVEYPPGAFAVFMPPTAFGAQHYNAAFKAEMALCGLATILVAALVLAELGVTRARLLACCRAARRRTRGARADLAEHLRRLARAADGARAPALPARLGPRRRGGAGARSLREGLPARAPAAGGRVRLAAGWGLGGVAAALAVFLVVALAVVVPFAAYDLHGVVESFRSQATRGLQVESLGASLLLVADKLGLYHAHVVETTGVAGRNLHGSLPDAVAAVTLVLEAAAVIGVWLLYARARDGRSSLPVAFAAAVAGFLAFTKVFSPQYLEWLMPLVVVAGGGLAIALTAASLVLGQAWFFHYHALFRIAWPVWLLVVRDLLVVATFAALAAALAQPRRWKIRIPSRSKTRRHSGLRRNQESWTAVGNGASRSA